MSRYQWIHIAAFLGAIALAVSQSYWGWAIPDYVRGMILGGYFVYLWTELRCARLRNALNDAESRAAAAEGALAMYAPAGFIQPGQGVRVVEFKIPGINDQ